MKVAMANQLIDFVREHFSIEFFINRCLHKKKEKNKNLATINQILRKLILLISNNSPSYNVKFLK